MGIRRRMFGGKIISLFWKNLFLKLVIGISQTYVSVKAQQKTQILRILLKSFTSPLINRLVAVTLPQGGINEKKNQNKSVFLGFRCVPLLLFCHLPPTRVQPRSHTIDFLRKSPPFVLRLQRCVCVCVCFMARASTERYGLLTPAVRAEGCACLSYSTQRDEPRAA
jgi:hypothetical protein